MHKYHARILEEIKKVARSNPTPSSWSQAGKYMGTTKTIHNITNPQTRTIAKAFVAKHKDLTLGELTDLLDSFFSGQSHTERSFGGKLLDYYPNLRPQIKPFYLDRWLNGAEGWGEVDSLCQNVFKADELLNNWPQWQSWLTRWSTSPNIHKRRASLVLLTGPVVYSQDRHLSEQSFTTINRLKGEKDILITKAISWLLRSLIRRQPDLVRKYLVANTSSLPKIAVRETANKLKSGRKSGK